MNFLWIFILACCCNKNNAGTCQRHKKQEKSCHKPNPQKDKSCSESFTAAPSPASCSQEQPIRECRDPQCQVPPPPSGCQTQQQGSPCQETQIPQELFQNQGRFCQHPF